MERKIELTAVLAMLGIASSSALAGATEISKDKFENGNGMFIAEKKVGASKKGGSSSCGKGSCGTDAKGAAAAKKKHSAKSAGKSVKKIEPAAKSSEATDKATSGK